MELQLRRIIRIRSNAIIKQEPGTRIKRFFRIDSGSGLIKHQINVPVSVSVFLPVKKNRNRKNYGFFCSILTRFILFIC